jgi:hypothetical protein
MSPAQATFRDSRQHAPFWRRVTLLYLLAMAAPQASGCGGSTEPGPNPTPTPSLDGHYIGGLNVTVIDTVLACSIFCVYPLLESVGCEVTTDLTMLGEAAFAGTFVIDSTRGGPGGTGVCNLADTHWLKLDPRQEIRSGSIDSVWAGPSGKLAAAIRLTLGDGSREAIEAFVGCRLQESWSTWEMRGLWAEAGMVYTYNPQSQSAVYLNPYTDPLVSPAWDPHGYLFECHGKAVLVTFDLSGER